MFVLHLTFGLFVFMHGVSFQKKQQTPKSGWFGKSSPPPPNPLEDDLNTALHEASEIALFFTHSV